MGLNLRNRLQVDLWASPCVMGFTFSYEASTSVMGFTLGAVNLREQFIGTLIIRFM